jgi:uncharacterized protein YdhG (YjbR/CyaY superfamily)
MGGTKKAMANTDFKSINEYIGSRPRAIQGVLRQIRDAIRKAMPQAEEGISYQIPAFKLNGRPVLYFAGWKNHYSIYPAGDHLVATLKKELARYERSKGTIRFPLSEPVPVKLIERIAKVRIQEVAEREKPRKSPSKKGSRSLLESPLDRVRRICSSMPSMSEKISHGTPTFFVQKDKGVFVMVAENYLDDGRLAVWLPAPPGLQSELISEAPETYFKPPYVGASGWIGIILDQVADEVLEIHVRKAWDLAAPGRKKKVPH